MWQIVSLRHRLPGRPKTAQKTNAEAVKSIGILIINVFVQVTAHVHVNMVPGFIASMTERTASLVYVLDLSARWGAC
jgi:hypothetical protein